MRAPFLSFSFFLLGMGTLSLAIAMGSVAAFALGWPAVDFLLLGLAYLGRRDLVFSKDPVNGRLALWSKVLLAPYLIMTAALWHLIRLISREPAHGLLAPGVFVGRRLLPSEYPAGILTIVDLTAEIDELRPSAGEHRYHSVPLLDGAALPPGELREVAARIAALPRPVYVHCAQGHGRTAMVAAALLLALGHVSSPSQALARVAVCRPGAKPNRAQRNSVLALEAA